MDKLVWSEKGKDHRIHRNAPSGLRVAVEIFLPYLCPGTINTSSVAVLNAADWSCVWGSGEATNKREGNGDRSNNQIEVTRR